ncbi:hypothetical protein Tco_1158897 [Tanacetum coccineum]
MTHPHPKGNFVPKAVLLKSGIKTLNTAGQNFSKVAVSVNTTRPINTAYPKPTVNYARPASNVFNKAHSHVRRPFNKFTSNKDSNLNKKVNTVKGNVTTVGPKAVVSDNKENEANAGNPQLELQSMRMEQYLINTDYSLWQVILNGDGPIQVTTNEKGIETEVPPKTAQALLQRQRERKAKSILLLAIPDEYQLRFHGIKDAKSLWAAIKSRFGCNVESKEDAEDCFEASI